MKSHLRQRGLQWGRPVRIQDDPGIWWEGEAPAEPRLAGRLALPKHRGFLEVALVIVVALMASLWACERQPQRVSAPPQTPKEVAPVPLELTAAMETYAPEPVGVKTGTFIDRRQAGDLRVVSYNINWDKIFPDKSQSCAEKFQRVVKALDPDILNLQEIGSTYDEGPKKTLEDVVELMNAIDPRPDGQVWHAYKGASNVILSPYPLSMTADTLDPPSYRDPAMALVDLPDERFAIDAYVLNNHFKSNSQAGSQERRQTQADALVSWLRDARSPGGKVDLPRNTAIFIVGDLNLVEGPRPLVTVLTGDIINEDKYGADAAPDWDGSELTDAHPLHNAVGPDDYTWRDDTSQWLPNRLDYVIYSDCVVRDVHKFVLNTTTMSSDELLKARLEKFDVTLDKYGRKFDHLPVVVDFRVVAP
ncbi:MAG: endonuclease/exonuclease/phosphatase family protein [Planctomycetota bacterium]